MTSGTNHNGQLTVIFPDWVGEIHTAQLQWLDWRQRTRIPKVLL